MQPINSESDIARGLQALRRCDSRLGAVIDESGPVPLRRSRPGFESLASIVVSQQVSKQSADAIWGRLTTLIDPLQPEPFLAGGPDIWRKAGLSRPKQRTLVAVSEGVLSGDLDLDQLCRVDGEAAIGRLTAVKGIGPWTAEIYLLFSAGHPDIFPGGDIALQNAVADAFGMAERPSDGELRVIAESWSPWRGVAARLFWAFYAARRGRMVAPQ
ncbi:DNA-3-methyladenine glycosylase family protein [Oricola cellulosilytica]|uniref:DNA-3-methyladenine glycosylase II n=1 Tax=Oricola cellulosilytica TaxID=1429082 RepID=A0A4R0PE95_9HYPH|nr:DNA-3-methyladenine glycosylase [Oricola cellulosilytica]TCD13693.1 DNA-3-methyladenine glycosylase 2 family protein [Oricola cellulosilytica]